MFFKSVYIILNFILYIGVIRPNMLYRLDKNLTFYTIYRRVPKMLPKPKVIDNSLY